MAITPHNLRTDVSMLRDKYAEVALTVYMQHHLQTKPDEDINHIYIATMCWLMANEMINMREVF